MIDWLHEIALFVHLFEWGWRCSILSTIARSWRPQRWLVAGCELQHMKLSSKLWHHMYFLHAEIFQLVDRLTVSGLCTYTLGGREGHVNALPSHPL
jgi:hypothetical protein